MHVNLADTLVIKDENLFLVTLRDGRLPAGEPHPLGLWFRDCRFLCSHELRLNGRTALLLQASDALGTRALHELTNPELPLAGGRTLPPQSISMRLERTVDGGGELVERVLVRSHHHEPLALELELELAADFEPMLAVRRLVEAAAREVERASDGARTLVFSSSGRDGVTRTTTVTADRDPSSADALRFALELPAGGSERLVLRYRVAERDGGRRSVGDARRAAPARTLIHSDDELFDRVLGRSLQDLELLRSELDGRSYFAAGVPWFATLFGRDSLITAMEMLSFVPGVAEETLRLLGSLMGRAHDAARDEQPGKVLHELRVGEPAARGETPFARYYGSADSTPLWLCLLCDHADWSGELELFRELRPQVDAALGWLEQQGDLDGDGLVEYVRRSPHGLVNQGWKDSWDGVPDAQGRPLTAPVALVEVQGYAIRALRRVARLFELEGEHERARALRQRADSTEDALERFWLPDEARYAIALDEHKRPGSGLTSNQGHLLWAGVVGPERARSIRDVLMSEAMFSGWGVRTLASGHPSFNPVGYHTGSVWPHDNAMIACGLRRYGFDEEFAHVFEAVLEAASHFNDYRLPELFGGYSRSPHESPVPYPVACQPQAWAAGTIPYLLKWGLGLNPDGLSRRLRLIRPSLPHWLSRVEVSGLRVAGATVDLHFERTGEHVTLADARIQGDLEVVLEIAGDRRSMADA